MKAVEIMTQDVISIRGAAPVAEAVRMMRDSKVRTLIVQRRNNQDSYGIVTETDVIYKVTAFGRDPQQMRVYEIMTKPCVVVNPELEVEYVARLFAQTGLRCAPIVQGELLGIISTTDILRKSNFVERPQQIYLQQAIQEAIKYARTVCQEQGATSKECAIAWEVVDELQTAIAHQKAERLEKTAFEEFCEEYPEALTAQQYDVWCSG